MSEKISLDSSDDISFIFCFAVRFCADSCPKMDITIK